MALGDQWYIALDPSKTEVKEVPSDLRGLDRIEYSSYSELGEKIQTVMAQRYPRRPTGTIDTYLAEQRKQVVGLLRSDPGLTVTSIAQVLGVDVEVAQLIVRPLIEEEVLRTEGMKKATKYYIAKLPKHGEGGLTTSQYSTRPARGAPEGASVSTPQYSDSADAVELNEKEQVVLSLRRRRRTGLHLEEIGATCFRGQSPERANSWARNSMRRLVANNLVQSVGRGIYIATEEIVHG
jgi:hypothetical protein